MAENAGEKQPSRGRGKPFAPGQSGNPAGKAAGARNKTTLALEQLLEGQAHAITSKCIAMALKGDTIAMRLLMERVAPVRRGRPVRFNLPELNGPADLVRAIGGILQATAAGDLSPDEAATVAGVLETKRRAMETVDLEARLAALEKGGWRISTGNRQQCR